MSQMSRMRGTIQWYLEGYRPYVVVAILFASVVIMDVFWPPDWSLYREVLILGLALSALCGYERQSVFAGVLLGATPFFASTIGSSTLRIILRTGNFPTEYLLDVSGYIPYVLVVGIVSYITGHLLRGLVNIVQKWRQSRSKVQ